MSNGCKINAETKENKLNCTCPNFLLKVKKLNEKAIVPKYQTEGSAGFDLHALVQIQGEGHIVDEVVIQPKSQYIIDTGLSFAVPFGFEMQIRPRSGLSFKHKITITNSPGTLDSDYRGSCMVILYNLGDKPFVVKNGDRIAQGVIAPIMKPSIIEVEDFTEEEKEFDRGGGFGSTGR